MLVLRSLAAAALTGLALWPASAAAADVTVNVLPGEVQLTGKGHAVVHVVVRNGTSEPMRRTVLRPLAAGAAGLKLTPRDCPARRGESAVPATFAECAPLTVPARAVTRFIVVVDGSETRLAAQTVNMLVRYQDRADQNWASAALKVSPPPEPLKTASVTVNASVDALRSGGTTQAQVAVANLSAERLEAGPVDVTAPEFVNGSQTGVVTIAPHDTELLAVDLSVDEEVTPGKHQIVFAVPIRVDGEGAATKLTAAKEADVTVKGEGALLTAFGVPALVLLPGAVLLGVPAILWRINFLRHASDQRETALDISAPTFAGLSVAASFAVLWVASLVGLDLFTSYGLDDIVALMGASAAAGGAGFVLWKGPRYALQIWRTPKATDSAITVIKKLGRQGLRVTVPRYGDAVMIQPPDATRKTTWFARRIRIEWLPDSGAARDQVNRAVQADKPDALASALDGAVVGGKAAIVEWDDPFERDTEGLGDAVAEDAIVYWED